MGSKGLNVLGLKCQGLIWGNIIHIEKQKENILKVESVLNIEEIRAFIESLIGFATLF